MIESIIDYARQINLLELLGLIFGLLAVYYLIKEDVKTWPAGIAYVLVSFVVFWEGRLYGDLMLHIFFLVLNIYGWYHWVYGKKQEDSKVPVSTLSSNAYIIYLLGSGLFIICLGYFLEHLHIIFPHLSPASLPYWDAATSALSITGMWLTARKKIENWHYWLAVDILATGIYFYKEIYFYAVLYGIYILLAILGYLEWKKIFKIQQV